MKSTIYILSLFALLIGSSLLAQTHEQYMRSLGVKDTGELDNFSRKVRTVRLEQDGPDEVIRKIGTPSGKSKMGEVDTWQYTFMGSTIEDIANSQAVLAYIQFDESDHVSCIKVMKQSGLNQETVFAKGTFSTTHPQKTKTAKDSPSSTASSTAPENPTEGQTYFNKTDKHFYGWDGKEWKQLDK